MVPGLRAGAPAVERWLVAVALGGCGRYATAATVLRALLVDPAAPRGVAAHAAVTLAAHRRQLGGHAAARRYDACGLRLADEALRAAPVQPPDSDGTDPLAARCDALVGLAADALGTGDARGAHRLLDAARASTHPAWRLAVRHGWVRAELALLEDRPSDAVEPAAEALAQAERAGTCRAGAVRHVLKSRVVLAVARAAADPRAAPAAVAELDAVRAQAAAHGQLPLCWPAALAASGLASAPSGVLSGAADAADARRHAALTTLSVLSAYADPVGRRLMGESVWVPKWQSVV